MLVTLVETSAFKMCASDNVLHVRMHRVLDASDLQDIERGMRIMAEAHGRGFVVLATMRRVDLSPPLHVREHAVQMMTRFDRTLVALAVVLEEAGIKASILRTVLNTIALAAKVRHMRVFHGVGPAAPWLIERLRAAVCAAPAANQILEEARSMATVTTPAHKDPPGGRLLL